MFSSVNDAQEVRQDAGRMIESALEAPETDYGLEVGPVRSGEIHTACDKRE